jgi:hypothetical protein
MRTIQTNNPTIVSAIRKAAHVLNVSPTDILEYCLIDFAERLKENPSLFLSEIAEGFAHPAKDQAETAAARLSELAAGELSEGKTQFVIACEVVERQDGFGLSVEQFHPANGIWLSSSGPLNVSFEEPSEATEEEDDEDWWKSTND